MQASKSMARGESDRRLERTNADAAYGNSAPSIWGTVLSFAWKTG